MTNDRPNNPLLKRLEHRSKQGKAYWQSPKKEKNLATRIGGRTTNASGSKREKGDVRLSGVCRLEHKGTANKSFSVTRDMLDKIGNAAYACDEIPAMVIEFINKESGKSEGEVAVIRMDDLIRLIDYARKQE